MNTYLAGTMIRIEGTCALPAGTTPVDPADVYLAIKVAGHAQMRYQYGVATSPIVRSETGTYYALIDSTTLSGQWTYQWSGTGQKAVAVGILNVSPTPLPPPFGG